MNLKHKEFTTNQRKEYGNVSNNTNRLYELEVEYQNQTTRYSLNDATEGYRGAFAYGSDVVNEHANAVAFGEGTITTSEKQMVIGAYNDKTNTGDCLLVIGNGSNASDRSNALTLDAEGDLTINGEFNAKDGVQTNNGTISAKG